MIDVFEEVLWGQHQPTLAVAGRRLPQEIQGPQLMTLLVTEEIDGTRSAAC